MEPRLEAAPLRYGVGMTRTRIVGVLLTALVACNEDPVQGDPVEPEDAQRYAEAMCRVSEDCGCEVFGPPMEDCIETVRTGFEGAAERSSLAFDRGCFEQVMSGLEGDPVAACVGAPWESAGCFPFEGTLDVGDACSFDVTTAHGLVVQECKLGLVCRAGRCASPSAGTTVALGERCGTDTGTCASGSYCASTEVCTEFSALGESCDSAFGCGPEGFCSGVQQLGDEGTCMPIAAEGASCEVGTPASCGYDPSVTCGQDGRCGGAFPLVCRVLGFDGAVPNGSEWLP